jgi:hypothetical protein
MAATITVSNLGASYDTLNKGTQLIITSTTDDIVSFTYMLTPGGNATGNAYDNSFITKTLLVGSDSAVKIGGTSPSFKYLLFIEEDETLCADDFYVIVSARNASGTSPYTDPETIYLTPIAPTVTGAVLERDGSTGYDDGLLTVTLAADVTCDKDVTMYFVLQFQEVGQTGYAVERIAASQVGSSLQYTATVTGLDQYGIVDDSLFVAVQAVRVIDASTEASSDLSNTVQATDSDQQLPPVDLRINYVYDAAPNGTTDVLFKNPPTYEVITPVKFYIYKQIHVDGEPQPMDPPVNIGTVPFDASKGTVDDYSFADVSANLYPDSMGAGNLPLNSVITYWATAVDGTSLSAPSNSASATVVVPSSAPTDLECTALINTEGSSTTYSDGYTALALSFTSPSQIEGEKYDVYNPARYEVTVTSNDGLINYTSGSGDWLYTDYEGSGVPITFNFPDEELPECTEGAELTVTVRLITSKGFDNSSDDLVGLPISRAIFAHTRPVITDINGTIGKNDFSRAVGGLVSFKVYYFGTLVPPGVSLLVENTNVLQIVEGALMQTQSGVVPDGYYRYAGAYERTYTIAGSLAASKDALMITACNQSGFAQTHASD